MGEKVPGFPLLEQGAGGVFEIACGKGNLRPGKGIIRMIHNTGLTSPGGTSVGAQLIILTRDDTGEVIFSATLQVGEVTPPLWIPFYNGFSAYQASPGVRITGE